jgi:dephospho-CoA kinase
MAQFDIVVGLTGLIAAGKDECGRRLAAKGFASFRTSDAIRAEAARQGIASPSREQLQDIGNRGREESGDAGYWMRKLLQLAADRGETKVIVNGVRNPGEARALESVCGPAFTLVGITAPTWRRWKRLEARRQSGDPATLEEFLARDDRDRGIGEPPHGQQVDRTLALVSWADLFDNAGSLEEYHAWIDDLAARLVARAHVIERIG